MALTDLARLRGWTMVPPPEFVGGNRVELLQGGDELFPRICQAIAAARDEVWLATYIFHSDPAVEAIAQALVDAAARGVAVHVVVDGFGSIGLLGPLRARFAGTGVRFEVFRALDRWWAWLQPGQLRRLHQKLCVCDGTLAFVGGINLIDDRHDLHHGWAQAPRLDFAVAVQGPLALSVQAAARAMWARAHIARNWRDEVRELARSEAPLKEALALVRSLRGKRGGDFADADGGPVRAAFLVRDNLRQRRVIERSYVEAIRHARWRVDLAVPYFYPGQAFRRALRRAARRGVQVRLLLQGKVDYRIAALAAQALYAEMRGNGVRVFEYTPAWLHAKVAVVDGDWATVGSSNIDPLSLLLNLEANVVVRDEGFAGALAARLETAFAASREVTAAPGRGGWRGWLQRALVAWVANVYLRVAGITGRY
ncbi:Cardiolipin synthase B [Rubrivivax sp. A210]|uniref:cardiolipin synthase ClsB n=1 Tax=Rubrivivax sp. A210 TaxID=2772301 RepID=UPI00191A2C13|nr:cardiolipin synthase ClsB [Rubrivivax sp. A210]CAD5369118.1 Cardiolipin synthase B [Rubrivivax sp. A210]